MGFRGAFGGLQQEFCPCALHTEKRKEATESLREILLADEEPWKHSGENRRITLGLILDFLQHSSGNTKENSIHAFLTACYGNRVAEGGLWELPDAMNNLRSLWALYLRN